METSRCDHAHSTLENQIPAAPSPLQSLGSSTRPLSPFVCTLTQPQCVFMSGFRWHTKSSDESLPQCLAHPGSILASAAAPLGVRQEAGALGPLFSSFLCFILIFFNSFFLNSCTLISHIPSLTDREGGEGLDFQCTVPEPAVAQRSADSSPHAPKPQTSLGWNFIFFFPPSLHLSFEPWGGRESCGEGNFWFLYPRSLVAQTSSPHASMRHSWPFGPQP